MHQYEGKEEGGDWYSPITVSGLNLLRRRLRGGSDAGASILATMTRIQTISGSGELFVHKLRERERILE